MYVYSYFIKKEKGIKIDKTRLWFIRSDKVEEFEYSEIDEKKCLDWFMGQIKLIKQENDFEPNNKNQYFCNQLCGNRDICSFRP